MVNCLNFQDAALVAMRSEVVAEVTKLRNQELEQAQQELRQQLQHQVPLHLHVTWGGNSPLCCYLVRVRPVVGAVLIKAISKHCCQCNYQSCTHAPTALLMIPLVWHDSSSQCVPLIVKPAPHSR